MPARKSKVERRLEKLGFVLEHTGGNCTAWYANDGCAEVYIISDGAQDAPRDLDESAIISMQAGDDDAEEFTTTLECILDGLERLDADGCDLDVAVEYVAVEDRS